jgi:hypothetical protein
LREQDSYSAKKEIDTNTTKIERGENMELNTKVKEQWQRLFDFYKNSGLLVKKCKGTTEEKIAEFENEFKVILPKAFADSFRICDERYIFNTSEKKGWFGENDVYSLNNTKYDWYNLFQVNRQIATYAKDIGWNKNWIEFYDYGTWFGAVLDTVTGKIYCYEIETGEHVIWANSYEEWLEMAVDEVVQYGELRLETMEKLLNIE